MKSLRIALVQTATAETKAAVVEKTIPLIKEAVHSGARIVCLQELFHLPYFCLEQNPDFFDLAEPIPGPTTTEFSKVAESFGIYIIVPLFESVHGSVYYNTVAVIGPDGALVGKYRKMHIPQDPGFEEKFFFAPGDLGWPVFETPWGKIGVMICWDQWYPEAARLMALQGARVIFYPTAIGRLDGEPVELGLKQHQAWETVQRGHGIANGCYIAACNRVGREGDTHFWGQSFVSDHYGSIIAKGSESAEQVVSAELDFTEQDDFRRMWPFFRDRRIDAYGDILKRVIE
jgi:N-carbamoylputrescine amidase